MDLCGVHPALSIEKEYPPGMPDRDVYTIAGRDGETAVGYAVVQGEYKVNVNIAARRREEGWRIRGLLAAWAMASGQDTGEIEPTHWPGVAYDGIVKSISTPECVFGFAKVEVIFLVPRRMIWAILRRRDRARRRFPSAGARRAARRLPRRWRRRAAA